MEPKNNDVFLWFNEETAFKVTKDGTLFIDVLVQRYKPVDHVDVELTLERKDNNELADDTCKITKH